MNKGKQQKAPAERAVMVTTAHRGVFFGYATDTDGETIALKRARLCLYWSADVKGFIGDEAFDSNHVEGTIPRRWV